MDNMDFQSIANSVISEYHKGRDKVKQFATKELVDFEVIDKIIRDMDSGLMIDDTSIAYQEHKYSVTLDEFNAFISVILQSGIITLKPDDSTVVFPIYYKDNAYTLSQIGGQGTVYSLNREELHNSINKAVPYQNVLKSVISAK